MPVVPTWLQQPAEEYSRGLALGAQVANERARLQAENQRTLMEAQARAQTLKQEQDLQQQRLAVSTAYQQQQIQLRQAQIDQVAQENAAKTKDAALKVADQMGLAKHVAGGGSIAEGMFKYPRATATPFVQMQKEDDIRQGRQASFNERKRHNMAMEGKGGATRSAGTISNIPIPGMGNDLTGPRASVPYDSPAVNVLLGDKAPPMSGTNYPGRNVPVPPPASAAPKSPFPEGARIKSKKDGKIYVVKNGVPVPEDQAADDNQGEE